MRPAALWMVSLAWELLSPHFLSSVQKPSGEPVALSLPHHIQPLSQRSPLHPPLTVGCCRSVSLLSDCPQAPQLSRQHLSPWHLGAVGGPVAQCPPVSLPAHLAVWTPRPGPHPGTSWFEVPWQARPGPRGVVTDHCTSHLGPWPRPMRECPRLTELTASAFEPRAAVTVVGIHARHAGASVLTGVFRTVPRGVCKQAMSG